MKFLIFFLTVIAYTHSFSQTHIPDYKKFTTEQILIKKDTITYHIYSPEKMTDTTGIILFIHGSGAFPMYNVKQENHSTWINSTVPFDLDGIPKGYAFVLVSKKCVPFLVMNETYRAKKCFYENESLDYRVWQNNMVLDHLLKTKIKKPKKVIAIGHSEGSDVVAKLGTVNSALTHIGFWSGSGHSQYYDFALMIRKEAISDKISEKESIEKLDSLFVQLQDIENNPNSIEKQWQENSYRRWKQFSEPPVANLLKVDIPIFVAIGTKDESVPMESSLVIKTEFIRNKKQNLTYRMYPNYDHNLELMSEDPNQDPEDKWMDVFYEFMRWTDKNKNGQL